MAWVTAAIGWMKRVVYAPPTWIAVWVIGTVVGILADREWLAVCFFLIAAPALLFTLFADMRRYEAPRPSPAGEPMDLASRVRRKKQRRILESFARDRDKTGHTLH